MPSAPPTLPTFSATTFLPCVRTPSKSRTMSLPCRLLEFYPNGASAALVISVQAPQAHN